MLRPVLLLFVLILGLVAVSAGVAAIYPPAGLIVGGLFAASLAALALNDLASGGRG